ncbi:thiamine-phosphate kinase [Vibrio palustris]|uniref:Thiamine-monophosphate kinase n=1 Tax=Vibrio palustris TaxID=1918946 RepID=A0A1R4AZY0_9VIBR|nr:thiamine-phosphate kinase [Vibrio palustris]SJL82236.1 Thiamine-monophosphate kinase [Vibrio palustris]
MPGEFDFIRTYLSERQTSRQDVNLALGDDCAIVCPPPNARIALSTDTLVGGSHFLLSAAPELVAHKALASNLSDLAAMGARPAWMSLALTLPEIDENWLRPFFDAFFALADDYGIQLIGGDTTKGPLSISLTVQGFVPQDKALLRSGAKAGDWLYVTGKLGDSKAGLDVILDPTLRGQPFASELEKRHFLSTPRVEFAQGLLGIASSAIDISDGLLADLQHILERSCVGASIDVSLLPYSEQMAAFVGERDIACQYALTSGEEYELCFTVPEQYKAYVDSQLAQETELHCIGKIESQGHLKLHDSGQPIDWQLSGYDHFKAS